MLSQDDLTKALKDGQGRADICDHYCQVGAVVDDGVYRIHHNHIGSKTDAQTIHADAVLNMNADTLAGRIKTWIEGLHQGERVNLNAAFQGGPVYRGPAMPGWPWRWADGSAP